MHVQPQRRARSGWARTASRIFGILAFLFICACGFGGGVPVVQAAAPADAPGGHISDPVVRQVDIARPAVVRIVTKIGAHLTVQFAPTTQSATFPLDGSSYPIELSGSGSFISAHGDILTADHVINPPHDQGLTDALYQAAANDIAGYVNTHFHTNQPFTADDVIAELETGAFPSTPAYDQPSSEVYLSASYAGHIDASRFKDIPANLHATVERIEAQSSFQANDVAIIHVSGMDDMPSIQLGNSDQVAELDNLTIIGFPGLADESISPTNLLTSSINRAYVSAIKTTDSNAPVIQVGGNVEHGDSGGPALDENGQIVGIVSFTLVGPGENGATSFLQASNSARNLVNSLNLDTAPGPFQQAWSRALSDYASPAPGHWHRAARELQDLVDGHPGFLGVSDYLAYAQNRADSEQFPALSNTTNPVLVIGLVLAGALVLVLLGVGFVLTTKRRAQVAVAPVAAPQTWSVYAQQQPGASSVYTALPASSPAYTTGPVAPQMAYPPTPASYSQTAWYEQPTGAIPPMSVPVTPVPEALTPPVLVGSAESTSGPEMTSIAENTVISSGDMLAHESGQDAALVVHTSAPTWMPLPQTPQPVEHRNEELFAVIESSAPAMVQGESTATVVETAVEQALTPETPQDEARTTLAQPPSASRSFSVPRRPVLFAQETQDDGSSGVHTWIAPCGHANTPEVRFCRVCGLSVQPNEVNES